MKRYVIHASTNGSRIGGGYDRIYNKISDQRAMSQLGCDIDDLDLTDAISAYGGMTHIGWAEVKPAYADLIPSEYEIMPILNDNGEIILGDIAGGRVYAIDPKELWLMMNTQR